MREQQIPGRALVGIEIQSEGDLSRGEVLLKGALAAGAFYGFSAVGPYVRQALANQTTDQSHKDPVILNSLLLFEYLQETLYRRGNSETNDKGEKMKLKPEEKELMELLLKQEEEHVAAVKQKIEDLGAKPGEKGKYGFAFRIFESLLTLAGELETIAAEAYNGAIYRMQSTDVKELAASIAQVEGRHAAAVLIMKKHEPAPEAFDLGLPEESAAIQVEQFTGVFPGE